MEKYGASAMRGLDAELLHARGWMPGATCLRLDVGLLEEEGQQDLLLGGHV